MKNVIKNLVGGRNKAEAVAAVTEAASEQAAKDVAAAVERAKPATTARITLDVDGEPRDFIVRRYPAAHGLRVARMIDREVAERLSNGKIGAREGEVGHLAVLFGVTAVVGGDEVAIDGEDAINTYTSTWQNLAALRREVLKFNMIDEEEIEAKMGARIWLTTGAEMAAGFLSASAALLESNGLYIDPKNVSKQ
ncbi:hypothetical protein PTE30175_05414 [Pandoraea terrae]|uniref:Uncharacterized protein n=1 Tax=Pandoraea terrae TaxID=1537710 RepID=A0A5E4ZDZ9_9BURK|nr:hypothetical protein [Pandoraea terrae]VVE59314.1 hypothetical protein PTE30175_05414 [Pandoraea terrae]